MAFFSTFNWIYLRSLSIKFYKIRNIFCFCNFYKVLDVYILWGEKYSQKIKFCLNIYLSSNTETMENAEREELRFDANLFSFVPMSSLRLYMYSSNKYTKFPWYHNTAIKISQSVIFF